MNESIEDKIARLKREYKLAEQSMQFRKLLGEKREVLEDQLQILKQRIEDEKFKFYRNKEESSQDSSDKGEIFQPDDALLQSVKKTKKELDAKLDEYDIFSTEMMIRLRNELIEAILELHPKKRSEYEKLKTEVENKLILLDRVQSIEKWLNDILVQLGVISKERASVKRQNIFRYLFGTNPNVAITLGLQAIEKNIKEALPTLNIVREQLVGIKNWNVLIQEWSEIFSNLQAQAATRWGWKKLDNEILPNQSHLESIRDRMKELSRMVEEEATQLRMQIDAWIEHNSKGTKGT